ncbi:MAG: MFS transporter [Anaerolineae bacterium]|nr:MFS transporter [Anaerolineae bacterium]
MSRKQMVALFLCNFVPWAFGSGVLPLLPLYAVELGAGETVAGTYLALVYLAMTVGSMGAGWVATLFHSRKIPLIAAGVTCVPLIWLMGQGPLIWGLTLLTALTWFCGGLGLALIGILAGLSAAPEERGRTFGLLTAAGGLGTLTGGLASGYLVDQSGFTALFTTFAAFIAIWPITGLFLADAEVVVTRNTSRSQGRRQSLGRDYVLYVTSALLNSITGFAFILIRSLLMNSQAFSAIAISTVAAIGSVVQLPLPTLFGWLSDRTGRKRYVALSRFTGILGLAALLAASRGWHFYTASVLGAIGGAAAIAVGSAWVTDLVPRESLDRGMAIATAAGNGGAVLGFAWAGFALQRWGVGATVGIAIAVTVISWLLLVPIRVQSRAGEFANQPETLIMG